MRNALPEQLSFVYGLHIRFQPRTAMTFRGTSALSICRLHRIVVTIAIAPFIAFLSFGQATTGSRGSFDFNERGIVFLSSDSSTHLVMRFRMQNWAVYSSQFVPSGESPNLSAGSIELAPRRLRLRFGGSIMDPRLTVNLQLAFSRRDMDWADTEFPNIIRDAMVFWNFTPTLQVGFGQTKLPGNRQRVVSSGDQEFADRSIVNSAFTLDRDFGFQAYWRPLNASQILNLRASITGGHGRNQPAIPGGGLAYTGRVEFLPLGAFTDGGDYVEGDLAREERPKLSLGLSAQHNESMTRTRGALGDLLHSMRTAQVIYADGLLKYAGVSVYGEWARRSCANPVTTNGSSTAAVFTGTGYLLQASYVFPSMISVAARYAVVEPSSLLASLPDYKRVTNLGANVGYYINGHRVKSSLEIGTTTNEDLNTNTEEYNLYSRLNLEVGI